MEQQLKVGQNKWIDTSVKMKKSELLQQFEIKFWPYIFCVILVE